MYDCSNQSLVAQYKCIFPYMAYQNILLNGFMATLCALLFINRTPLTYVTVKYKIFMSCFVRICTKSNVENITLNIEIYVLNRLCLARSECMGFSLLKHLITVD